MVTLLLFAVGIFMGSMGAIFLKKGAIELPAFSLSLQYAISVCLNGNILAGLFLYFVPALIWIYLLTKFPVSVVQPILALTYVLTPMLATIFLGETVPVLRWIGIFAIIIGVCIVANTQING